MRFNRTPFAVHRLLLIFCLLGASHLTLAAEGRQKSKPETIPKTKPAGMNNAQLDALIRRIDKTAEGRAGYWKLNIQGHVVAVITDEKADRMRIVSAVAKADEVGLETLQRLIQANFDSALDARYSIAKSEVWSVFIHPLAALSNAEFLSGMGQVINLGSTYGTTFSSGALIFNGSDTAVEQQRRELIERLLIKGLAI